MPGAIRWLLCSCLSGLQCPSSKLSSTCFPSTPIGRPLSPNPAPPHPLSPPLTSPWAVGCLGCQSKSMNCSCWAEQLVQMVWLKHSTQKKYPSTLVSFCYVCRLCVHMFSHAHTPRLDCTLIISTSPHEMQVVWLGLPFLLVCWHSIAVQELPLGQCKRLLALHSHPA